MGTQKGWNTLGIITAPVPSNSWLTPTMASSPSQRTKEKSQLSVSSPTSGLTGVTASSSGSRVSNQKTLTTWSHSSPSSQLNRLLRATKVSTSAQELDY